MGFSCAVPRLGFEPKICLARPILVEALECYEKGDHIGAGVRLRESVTRYLIAAIDWYAVEVPKRAKRNPHPRPVHMAKALRDAKVIDCWGHDSLCACIDIGNAAAHCRPFDAESLQTSISILFAQIDSEPFSTMKERQPDPKPSTATDYDVDDCDDEDRRKGDWWKPEGWNPGGDV